MSAIRSALAVLVLIALAAPAAAQPPKARKVAFLVGVGTFQHGLPDLHGTPQRDVAELGKVLKAGGFEVVTLTDAKATKAEIEARFKAVLGGGGDALGRHDVLLVATNTHGYTLEVEAAGVVKRNQPFLAAYDSKPGESATMVSLTGLIDAAKPFGANTLFLIDACREATDLNRGVEGTQMSLPPRMAVLFACGRGQVAYQSDKAGGGHGLFTFAVFRALRGDTGLMNTITWTDLVSDVEKRFKSPELRQFLPPGKDQTPFETKGELSSIPLLTVDPVLRQFLEYEFARARLDNRMATMALQVHASTYLPAWRRAADAGQPHAQYLLGACYCLGAGVGKDLKAGAAWLRKSAASDLPAAMNLLGVLAVGGFVADVDRKDGLNWIRKSAERGSAEGMYYLSQAYLSGVPNVVAKDEKEALAWLRKSADAVYPRALLDVGVSHAAGRGVAKDEAEAARWFERAVAAQVPQAMYNLAGMYLDGRGVAKDPKEAFRLYQAAASFLHPGGMNNTGYCYRNGIGVEQDFAEAVKWYRKATDFGHLIAMNNLGGMYESGRGVPKDIDEAVRWYTKAAQAGHAPSQADLKRLGK